MNLKGLLLSLTAEMRLVSRTDLTRLDRAALERRSRALARSAYVGDRTVLCRILGRYRLYVASDDVGFGVHIILDGMWEGWLTVFMARLIRPGMHIVDAGANHGYYSMLFADLAGMEGTVAAIEPNPRTATLLRRSVQANGFDTRITVFEQAAGADDGVTLNFHAPASEPKNARVLDDVLATQYPTFPVSGARLDTMLAGWPRVDFMKIDVEGAEEAFLEGAWPIILRDRPALVLEFNALRCRDAEGLLDRLAQIYGQIGIITFEGQVIEVPRAELLDLSRHEDWLLYLTPV